jgi:hypothetical protein
MGALWQSFLIAATVVGATTVAVGSPPGFRRFRGRALRAS